MKKFWKNPTFYLVLAFAVMGILFFSSSQTYEQQSQIGLLNKLLKNEPFKEQLQQVRFNYAGSEVSIAAKGYFSFVEFFIRKGAHFMTYFLLSGSLCLALYYKLKNIWWAALYACLAASGYAALDEYHQMLTGGRTPLFQDVMLDTFGALTAVVLIILVILLKGRRTH